MKKSIVLFLALPIFGLSQTQILEQHFFSIQPKIGFLAAHSAVLGHIPKERCAGVELSYFKRVGGNKKWHSDYKQPFVGATAIFTTLGNNAILGQGIGVYAFVDFPMNKGKRHVLSGRAGSGLGYVTKVFDQQTNPKDVAVSTHFNALICLGIRGRFNLSDKHTLIYGFDLTHYSNGAYRVPNLGLNMPFMSLGYAYKLKSLEREVVAPTERNKTPFFSHWKTDVFAYLSTKQVFPTGRKNYPVYAASIGVKKLFRPKVGMEIRLDLFSKQSLFAYRSYIPKTQWDIFQIGTYVGYLLPLDHFQFVVGMGCYVKDRYNADDKLYHRVGMRYQFDNGIIANVVLKSHWAKADYAEWGIGYTFNSRK